MKKASFILPPFVGYDRLTSCLQSLLAQNQANIEILAFQDENSDQRTELWPSEESRILAVSADYSADTLPGLLNRAIVKSNGDVLIFIADYVEFLPGFTKVYLERVFGQPGPAWAYGRFREAIQGRPDRHRDVMTDAFDFSEGSQIGPVRAFKRACFETVGVYDEKLHYAFEYDLRLRMLERCVAVKVEEPLYLVRPGTDGKSMRTDMEHYRSYVRSAGPSRPRSYLDYHASEEKDFRTTCYRSLKRRGAFLNASASRLSCRHSASPAEPVTVIIPLWNREEYIEQALRSVLESRDCTFEVVVVDNGSTDQSIEIVQDYMSRGPIRLIRNEINNIAGALNAGIRESQGKFICQLDSDDLYTPETLCVLVQHMEANPNSALGVSYYDCIGPDGQLIADRDIVRHLEYDPNNLMRTDGIGHARIWHRCVIEALGGFDEYQLGNYAEDYDMQLKFSEQYEVLRIPHVLYHYRLNHKKPGEQIDYSERHRKKTWARRAAIERRKSLRGNGPFSEDEVR